MDVPRAEERTRRCFELKEVYPLPKRLGPLNDPTSSGYAGRENVDFRADFRADSAISASADRRRGHQGSEPLLSHEDQIVAAIRQIIRAVDLQSRRLVSDHGMTGPQLAVLQETARTGPTSPSALARSVHLSQATVTGILQRLERQGLIERTPSTADRRSVLVEISSAGHALLEASPSLLQDRFRDGLSALQEWERLQILSTLQRVASLMDAGHLDASPHLTSGDIPLQSDWPGDSTANRDGSNG